MKEIMNHLKNLIIVMFYLSLSFATEKKNWVIEDTMIIKGKGSIFKSPKTDVFHRINLKPNSIVYVLDKKPVPNETKPNGIECFLKIKTPTGQTGYIWIESLITKKQFQQHQESLNLRISFRGKILRLLKR